MIQRHIFVSGRVQGVGFRAFVFKNAKTHENLQGFVRNLEDGRVEARIAGRDGDVLSLVALCKKGPASSSVTELEVIEEPYDATLGEFQIL